MEGALWKNQTKTWTMGGEAYIHGWESYTDSIHSFRNANLLPLFLQITKKTIHELIKIQRNFLWGGGEDVKKNSLGCMGRDLQIQARRGVRNKKIWGCLMRYS